MLSNTFLLLLKLKFLLSFIKSICNFLFVRLLANERGFFFVLFSCFLWHIEKGKEKEKPTEQEQFQEFEEETCSASAWVAEVVSDGYLEGNEGSHWSQLQGQAVLVCSVHCCLCSFLVGLLLLRSRGRVWVIGCKGSTIPGVRAVVDSILPFSSHSRTRSRKSCCAGKYPSFSPSEPGPWPNSQPRLQGKQARHSERGSMLQKNRSLGRVSEDAVRATEKPY